MSCLLSFFLSANPKFPSSSTLSSLTSCFFFPFPEKPRDDQLIEMEMNQLDCDSHLPPRKRLLAGFKKLNGSSSYSSPPSAFASSSSTSNSNGSSSSDSTDVQTHLNNLLADQNQSPEELVEATRSAAALAVKAAKAARAIANEKALISAKAIAAARRALELVDSFPKEAMATTDCKERSPKKNKQKKHAPVDFLYSKAQLRRRDEEEDLARRLHRAIDNRYTRVLRTCEENGQRNKKQNKNKNVVEGESSSIVTNSVNDIAGVVDSDSSFEGLELNRTASKALKLDEAEEESNSLGKRRGRVKLKKLPLSVCNSRDTQEIGSSSSAPPLPVKQGSSSWKCQDTKAPECVKQNKAVRS